MKGIFFLVLPVLAVLASFTGEAVSEEKAADAAVQKDGDVDNLDNGTLIGDGTRHSRPARAVSASYGKTVQKELIDHLTGSVTSNFLSRYVSYGFADSAGWVWQPSATIEFFNVGFNVWGNFVIEDKPDRGTFNEIDLTLYYNYTTHNFTVHPYFTVFVYPDSNRLSLDYSSKTDVLPSLHLAYKAGPLSIFTDIQVYVYPSPGALRGVLGLGLDQKLVATLNIAMSAEVGFGDSIYNENKFKIDEGGFTFFQYTLALPWNPVKGFVVKPVAHVCAFMSTRYRNAVSNPVQVWGGLELSYQF
ncbi:MAG: hypothetical protein WC889_11695 [Myxococcota bacterium]|jgi:hypothetical protein